MSDLNISTTQPANRNWEIMYKTKAINYALIRNNSFTVSALHQLQNDTCQNTHIPTHNRKKLNNSRNVHIFTLKHVPRIVCNKLCTNIMHCTTTYTTPFVTHQNHLSSIHTCNTTLCKLCIPLKLMHTGTSTHHKLFFTTSKYENAHNKSRGSERELSTKSLYTKCF